MRVKTLRLRGFGESTSNIPGLKLLAPATGTRTTSHAKTAEEISKDSDMPKRDPIARTKSDPRLTELVTGWVNVPNDRVDSLRVRQLAGIRVVFEVFQEISEYIYASREVWCKS